MLQCAATVFPGLPSFSFRSPQLHATKMRHKTLESRVENEPEQNALFQIEGPDEDGCVWICSVEGRDVWCQNLGPTEKVSEVLSQWLGSIDHEERL